jgi:hypothetical protein
MEEQQKTGEALFDKLSQEKKQRRRKRLRRVIIIVAVIFVALVMVVSHLRKNVDARFAATQKDVQSYTVAPGTIHTLVSGSGVLEQVDEEDVTVPAGVEVDEVIAEAGDAVAKGDLLAKVDMASVVDTLSSTQDQIKTLDKKINSAKSDTASTSVTTSVGGRVKKIYAQVGDNVVSSVTENGALALLSVDGYMAVDFESDSCARGDAVTVTLSDGTAVEGTVESATLGTVTVLVTDNGPALDEEVTVADAAGKTLGTGKLYIHSPVAVTGYVGTVKSISCKENANVTAGSTLMTLRDTKTSANFDALLRQRQDLEDTLTGLLTIYRDGAVLASQDGLITSVEYDEDTATSATETQILTLYPQKQMTVTISIDETDILSLKEGQEAQITVSSVSDDAFTGSVTSISKAADTSTGVTRYSAKVTLDREEGMLVGMTADVDVRIEGTENALIIPVDALHQNSASYYVYTGYDEAQKRYTGRTEVTIGMQNDDDVEITSGLKEGDTVYYTEADSGGFGDFMVMPGGMSGGMSGGMPSGNMGGGRPSGGGPGGMGG